MFCFYSGMVDQRYSPGWWFWLQLTGIMLGKSPNFNLTGIGLLASLTFMQILPKVLAMCSGSAGTRQ